MSNSTEIRLGKQQCKVCFSFTFDLQEQHTYHLGLSTWYHILYSIDNLAKYYFKNELSRSIKQTTQKVNLCYHSICSLTYVYYYWSWLSSAVIHWIEKKPPYKTFNSDHLSGINTKFLCLFYCVMGDHVNY